MFAAVVAGIYDKVEDAQKAMGMGFAMEYYPISENVEMYSELYKNYVKLGQFTENKIS
jgi:L-ribulokinase